MKKNFKKYLKKKSGEKAAAAAAAEGEEEEEEEEEVEEKEEEEAPRPDNVFLRVRFSPRRGGVVTVVSSSPVPSPTPLEWSTVRSCS